MNFKYCILISICCAMYIAAEDCDSVKCPSTPKHYDELGCEAITNEGDCCVSSYKCPDTSSRDHSKCYYKSETFNGGDELNQTLLVGTCSVNCRCLDGSDENGAEIKCAHIDCPENFGRSQSKKCIHQYDRTNCCSIKTICDDDVDNLATCDFEGHSYHEGQNMYPKNLCYKCFCTKDFNNSTGVEQNENCQKIDCGITLRNMRRIMEGCIPVYFKTDNCCPIGWRCPGDKHMVPNETARNVNDSIPHCTFGKMIFNVGESLSVESKNQKCTCKNPPMLHCIQTY